jgi:hypothetical protein
MASNSMRENDLFVVGAVKTDPRQRLRFRGNEPVALEPEVFDTATIEALIRVCF